MEEYKKIVAEVQALAAENQHKIDILLADMNRQELRNTRTDAAALADLERDLLNLAKIKRAGDRGLLRCAAATLRKVRYQLLDDADRAALCERCMNPHVLKGQDELDDVCARCPLEKTVG